MKRLILAHDLGTTGDKASLYDERGKLLGSTISSYETYFERPGWAEQDPEAWWRAVCTTTRQLLEQLPVAADEVAGIVFSGQMMGCVPLGRDARALRNAIIWADQRAVEQQRRLAERIEPAEVYRLTGHRLSSSYSLCKILWLRDHQPDIYDAAHAFVHAKDAIVARLTGAFVTDYSDASGMNLLALEPRAYAEPILAAAELGVEKLPTPLPATTVVGEVARAVADEVGLPAGTPVVIGGGDGCCATLGAGVVRPGSAYAYLGSSAWIALAADAPILDPEQRTFTWAHVVPERFSPCGTMQAAGASYQWARDQLGLPEVAQARRDGSDVFELLNALAAGVPPGAEGLLFLPYLLGERSPRWNPDARGAFVGLTVRHSRAHMVRAVLEGITMNLRLILEALTHQGVQVDELRLIGGGAKGRFWNQLIADITGVPVTRLAHLEEATSLGAAVTGGVAVGLYPDFGVVEAMNPPLETLEPDAVNHARYNELLPLFDAGYHALEPLFARLADR